ncbi:hypothetical protein [Mucilaginibacter psychrotolerans]|uniref:Uncharacterized protein n=1 Tax=Mucilaginibacter psychrotolerans TaxID=1524096 RepID=A0A4Y8S7Z3_9SPHI|nr:hypothetical protein [Mucilaginibacter psychrotolerans]TFF34544.1 hypothetical protein E2R66_21585 [Mucilaginibacter psychrotolerans]
MQTLSAIRNIRPKPQSTTRCAGRTKGQSQISPGTPSTDGFLNHTFIPVCEPAKRLPEQSETEIGFFRSASHLAKLHNLTLSDVSGYAYPYNILLAHREIRTKLNRQPYETELLITKTGNDKQVALATEQVYEVGNQLYYIPVIPLYRFLRKKENRRCGALLLAVMSYLYREAGVPYYRDEGWFMYDEYDMNKECFLECLRENPDDYEEDISDILRNDVCGDIMQRKLFNPYHLKHLDDNIARFKPANPFQEECHLIAQDTLQLFRDFSKNSIFQNIAPPDEDDDNDDIPTPETYIAFIGDGKGWVYENIERSVNDYLGNYSQMALPSRTQVFDGTDNEVKNLEFEYRLFEIIENLCNILFDLP